VTKPDEVRQLARELFGHPRGLTVLATTEMWERFSFYGMQALLMLYMTKYLLLPEHARQVLGLAQFRSVLENLTGPMTDLAFAAQTYGIYSGLIYGTPLIGAWLGDRVLGKTRTVSLGCGLMSLGHLAMAWEHFFLFALSLIILGAGGVIGNMAAQVGQLYAPEDHRRTRAFGVYVITLNIGALAAPLVIGTLGEQVSWHYGFGAAGIGMVIGLMTYLHGLPPDRIATRAERAERPPMKRKERRQIGAILLLLLPYILYSAVFNQAYAVMYIWADTAVDRKVLGWEMPVTWIGVVDGLFTVMAVFLANRIWLALERRGREPGDLLKVAIGFALVVLAYAYAAAIALLSMTPVLLWVGFYLILDMGCGCVEPPIAALISRDAPQRVAATMMTALKSTGLFSNILLGWLGRFYEPLGASRFWLLQAGLVTLSALALFTGRRRLARALGSIETRLEA
jgi:proton-dependent oligopeptide transporter, POT family